MSQIKFVLYKTNKTTKDGRKFSAYSTTMNLLTKGEEDKGLQTRRIDVRFDKNLSLSDIKGRGELTCLDSEVIAPSIYEVTEEVKDGKTKKRYPSVFVKSFVSYEFKPKKATQSAFVTCEDLDGEEIVVDNAEEE